MLKIRNLNRIMDAKNHFKNEESPKSRMSKGNFLQKAYYALLIVSIIFSGWSCEDEKIKKVEIKLSEDICTLCSSNPVHTVGDDLITISQVVTPNGDMVNDVFWISVHNPDDGYIDFSEKYPNHSIIFYDRDNNQMAFDFDGWGWDCRVNGKSVSNGLYSFSLTINGKEM